MANTHTATALATDTKDAYSYRYYGKANWTGCIDMLQARGYNSVEVDAILRSTMTRWANEDRTGRKAQASDLARLLDTRMGGPTQLRDYIDEVVLNINAEDLLVEVVYGPRLVWTNPNAKGAIS